MHSTLRPLFLILAIVALTAACTTSSGTSAAPSAAAPSAAAPSVAPSEAAPSEAAPSEAAPSAAAGDVTIDLTTNALGSMIVDADGKSLYAFTPDTAGTSTCYDDCATAWPPLLADGAVTAGEGLDQSKLTTVDRTDGTKQVKYGDWPLYYFAGDTAAGDTNGQGVGSKWYVVDTAGALIGQ